MVKKNVHRILQGCDLHLHDPGYILIVEKN